MGRQRYFRKRNLLSPDSLIARPVEHGKAA
jgi:hypothetical protein